MNDLESLEIKISKFLRFGVLFAGFFILVGWLLNFQWSGNPFAGFESYDHIQFSDLALVYYRNQNWGVLICYVGLFLLISLPIIRVLLTAILFLKQKEFILAGIALFVLSGLLISFTLGIEL
jgi:uncharacterized membrane protein